MIYLVTEYIEFTKFIREIELGYLLETSHLSFFRRRGYGGR